MASFAHAPEPGHWSLLAYGAGQPIEYQFSGSPSVARACFEARWLYQPLVRIRDGLGNVVYDGPAAVVPNIIAGLWRV